MTTRLEPAEAEVQSEQSPLSATRDALQHAITASENADAFVKRLETEIEETQGAIDHATMNLPPDGSGDRDLKLLKSAAELLPVRIKNARKAAIGAREALTIAFRRAARVLHAQWVPRHKQLAADAQRAFEPFFFDKARARYQAERCEKVVALESRLSWLDGGASGSSLGENMQLMAWLGDAINDEGGAL